MTILKILTYPNPRLYKIAKPVDEINKCHQDLIKNMIHTMYEFNGIGLAATQVDFHERIIVIDISDERNDPKVFINPEFKVLNDKSLLSFNEGCLSVPGVTEEIVRPDSIYLTWQDVKGEHHADEPSGLLTVCIQHEIDHLEGKLMVDYLSPLKRDRIRKKASK